MGTNAPCVELSSDGQRSPTSAGSTFSTLSISTGSPKREGSSMTCAPFTRIPPGKAISDYYTIDASIYDAGSKGQVAKCIKVATGEEFVMKLRQRTHFRGNESVWRTVTSRVLSMQRCLNIVDFYEILEDEHAYYIVMEPCDGGELFKFLLTESQVPESECKRIMREILMAVDHLHQTGLIHRDIKPENILFEEDPKSPMPSRRNRVPANTLKLIDFDTCEAFDPATGRAKPSRRIIGTFGYIAPESYLGEYTQASDLWSVGVILYILMTGDMPYDDTLFAGAGEQNLVGTEIMIKIHDRLMAGSVDWDCEPWPKFPNARDLCQNLLAVDPHNRIQTANLALQHSWLVDELRRHTSARSLSTDDSFFYKSETL